MKKDFSAKVKGYLADTVYYIVGSVFYSLGLYTFALNAHFSPGGVSGLSIIINHYTGFPIGVVALVLNIPLIIICLKIIGRSFLLKSIWVMVISTVFLDIIFPLMPTYSGNPLLAAMFTGIFLGSGMAIIYMRGASTGGIDFVIMAVKKKNPHFSIGQITLAVDALIILLGGVAFGNVDAVLYGIIASLLTTLSMDRILYGAGSGKMAIIITDHGQQVAEAISIEVDRGSTILDGKGTYTGESRDVLLCVCSKSQLYKVRMAARSVDPGSMVIVAEASEVLGEGFSPPMIPGNEDPAAGHKKSE